MVPSFQAFFSVSAMRPSGRRCKLSDLIELVNPHINAVVVDTFTEARRQAREADRVLAERPVGPGVNSLPPLFGVAKHVEAMWGGWRPAPVV